LYLVIQPSGFKSWVLRFRRPNRKIAKIVLGPVTSMTLAEARQRAKVLNGERAAGKDIFADAKAAKHRRRVGILELEERSFAAAAKAYIVEYAKPKTRSWKETATNLGLTQDLELRQDGLAGRWSERNVKHITDDDLFAAIEEARRIAIPGVSAKSRGSISEARAKKLHSSLTGLFTWLLRRRWITSNPTTTLSPPEKQSKRQRVLTNLEIETFWEACGDGPRSASLTKSFGEVFRLLLITGARRDEIADLRWVEVSDDGSTLTIPGSRTKNKLDFIIPLPPLARSIIQAQPRLGPYVFSTTQGRRPISGWSKQKTRLNVAMWDLPDWVIHDLRRTCATGMASIKVPPHIIEACLNHVSGFRAGVAGNYNMFDYLDEKREALERWEHHLLTLTGSGL
jgi:integrase